MTHTESVYQQPALFIDGEWLGTAGRRSQAVLNPADVSELGQVPYARDADLDRALAAADRAFPLWRATSPIERGAILKRAAGLVHQRAEAIARLTTLETGKPLAEARLEAHIAAIALEWYGEEGRRAYGRVIPTRFNGSRFMVVKEPVGPIAAFAAWNFPLDNAARKLGAALAAGCSCIYKPAEEVPASSLAIARALIDAGVPNGVIAVVFGVPAHISEYLLKSPVIRKISFTGSVSIGKHLMKLAADGMKRSTMELGGHAPVLIFEDADMKTAVDLSVIRKYRNAGQVCVGPTRFYVQGNAFEKFCEQFAAGAKAIKIGNGLDESTQMGPLAHARRIDFIQGLIDDAVSKGARLMAGGKRIARPGYFFEPTVLADVPDSARIMHEEPFGPVAIINRFGDFADGIAKANSLPYGLAAFSFTRSSTTMLAVADALEAGMVAINSFNIALADTPFGGIKDSGHGSENGIEGVEACMTTKTISLA